MADLADLTPDLQVCVQSSTLPVFASLTMLVLVIEAFLMIVLEKSLMFYGKIRESHIVGKILWQYVQPKKSQTLLSWKNKKSISECLLLKFLPSMQSVKH